MKFRNYIFTFFILIFILSSCKKEENMDDINDELNPITKVITSESSTQLLYIDSLSLLFASGNSKIESIQVGDIIASDMNINSPDGYLRKVKSIERIGANIKFNTELATIAEAVKNGQASFKRTFTDADILSLDTSGIDPTKRILSPSFNFHVQKTFDLDNNSNTTNDRITIEGNVNIDPTSNFDINIQNYSLKYFLAKLNLKNETTFKVSTDVGVNKDAISTEFPIAVFQLKPFTILISGLPVPIAKQWIVLLVGIDGRLQAEIVLEPQNTLNYQIGLEYKNNQWNTISDANNNFQLLRGDVNGEASVEGWIQARYEVRPYGLSQSKIYLAAKTGIKASATLQASTQNLVGKIEWGAKFLGNAQMKIFSTTIANYYEEFWQKYWTLWEGNYAPNIPIIPTNGLIAYYPFNGNANDESGNGNNGTVNGATPSPDRKGNANKAYKLDGINDYIQIPYNRNLLPNNDAKTYCFWFKFDSTSTPTSELYIQNGNADYSDGQFRIGINASGRIHTHLHSYWGAGGLNTVEYLNYMYYSVPNFNKNIFHFLSIIVNNKEVKYFIDGVLVASKNWTLSYKPYDSNYKIEIGRYYNSYSGGYTEYFNGQIDELRIYDNALNDIEIQALFNE